YVEDASNLPTQINLSWLMQMYASYADNAPAPKSSGSAKKSSGANAAKSGFFTPFFEKLAGTALLRDQIQKGATEDEIRASWQEDLKGFMILRKKYLLYDDFGEKARKGTKGAKKS